MNTPSNEVSLIYENETRPFVAKCRRTFPLVWILIGFMEQRIAYELIVCLDERRYDGRRSDETAHQTDETNAR